MTDPEARNRLVRSLEREPLRNIVLLKHLAAFPDSTRFHCVTDSAGTASLVLLDSAASPYDRTTYPAAAWVALISSDHPNLTTRLLDAVPGARSSEVEPTSDVNRPLKQGDLERDSFNLKLSRSKHAGVVFKLTTDADRDAVAARFPIEPARCFLSYTSSLRFSRDPRVRVTGEVDEAVLRLFEDQGHPSIWFGPLLASGRAFACVVDVDGDPGSVCFAFQNYGRVWEIGGVFTRPHLRGRGLAAMAVRSALAVFGERGLTPRYQVSSDNAASIALAEAIGLQPFLTLTHYQHRPTLHA